MKLLRFIVISVVALFATVTAVSLFFPSQVIVSRAIDIQSSKYSVVHYLSDLHLWQDWIEGMKDASVVVHSAHEAKLNKTLVTIDSINNKQVFTSWVGDNGRRMQSVFQLMNLNAKDSSTITLHWQFEQKVRWYPWEKFASMMNDKILGTMMEKNLSHLKDCVEKQIHL